MTTRYYLDGVEVVGRIRVGPEGGLAGLERSAQGGAYGSGGVIIDDPLGVLDIKGWRPFYVEEDESTPARIWTGFVNYRKISEMNPDGVSRIWDCDLGDLNLILDLQCWRGLKRPAEHDIERIAWMLANWPAADWPVYDNGGVTPVFVNDMDDTDLDGEFPSPVLSSMTMDLAMYFLYWDHEAATDEEVSVFWGPVDSARGTLAVSLSNDPDDIDGETCFAALVGEQVNREPGYTYSGIYLKFVGGKVYRQNETTASTYIRRDKVVNSTRIGKLATATNAANRMLAGASTEKDALTCTVRVRNDQVNAIQEGYRIASKFTHLPGYETGPLMTIQRLTVRRPENGNEDYYELDLVLSNSVPAGSGPGGGDPGELPHQPTSASIVQQVSGESDLTMPAPITPGNTLVYVGSARGPNIDITSPTDYITCPGGVTKQTGFFGDPDMGDSAACFYKLAGSGESSLLNVSGLVDTSGTWYELPGEWLPDNHDEGIGTGSDETAGPISAAANSIIFGVAGIGEGGGFDASAGGVFHTPGAGWTEDYDLHSTSGHPVVTTGHRILAAAASVTFNPTSNTSGQKWVAQVVEFVSTNPIGAPPDQVQDFGPVAPVETPDGATYTFTLPAGYEFADESLKVLVDRLDQTLAVTSYDGAARTFTLAFAPWGTDIIEVYGKGR